MKRCLAEKQPERRIAKVCTGCSWAPDCWISRYTGAPHQLSAIPRLPIVRKIELYREEIANPFGWNGTIRILTTRYSAKWLTGADADLQVANHQRPLARPPSPQWSIATIKSLDISSNIPKIVAMDAEDSPWGGMSSFHRIQARSTFNSIFKMSRLAQVLAQTSAKMQSPKNLVSHVLLNVVNLLTGTENQTTSPNPPPTSIRQHQLHPDLLVEGVLVHHGGWGHKLPPWKLSMTLWVPLVH